MSTFEIKLKSELDQLNKIGRTSDFFQSERPEPGYVFAKGKRLVDFTNWDILGLRYEKSIKRAFLKVAEEDGLNSSSARASSGNTKYHDSCEKRLAKFFGGESAALFSSRNQAVLSVVLALTSESDLVLFDQEVTSPVEDAAYLVNAKSKSFSFENLKKLDKKIFQKDAASKTFCFLETVSMEAGKVCAAEDLALLMQTSGINVILDESFAVGAANLRGAGVFEELSVKGNIISKISDLSGILSTWLTCVVGSKSFIDLLKASSRTFRLEVSPPNYLMAAIEAAIDVVELKHHSREKLSLVSSDLRSGLIELGFTICSHLTPHIVSIEFSKGKIAREFQTALSERGFLCDYFPSQKTFSETGLIRFILQSTHTKKQINSLLSNLFELKKRILL